MKQPRRVLSMWQPWASYLLHPRQGLPVKRWETRAFHPMRFVKDIPLPIECAIHAALNRSALRDLAFRFPEYVEANKRAGLLHETNFPRGMIIGIATIVEVLPTISIHAEFRPGSTLPDELDRMLGNYAPGRYAWRMAFAQVLPEPIPFKGRQSVLWQIDAATDRKIDEQLAR